MKNDIILKTDRQVRIKIGRSKSKAFVREQYLRSDIPCQCILCEHDCKNDEKNGMLPADVTHYLVPCADAVGTYIEILEFSDFVGILFTQTVVSKCLQEFGKRHYNKICTKVRDLSNKCIYFPNEFNAFTFSERQSGESSKIWQMRNIYSTTAWYHRHLNTKMPLVVVTEDQTMISEYKNKTVGIFFLSVGEYLTSFWPQLTSVHELYYSLNASLKESSAALQTDGKDHTDYLPDDILTAGLNSGKYLQGKLHVNKHQAQKEAFVLRSQTDTKSDTSDVLIAGSKHRNRAIHGDVVVVELLPRSEWKGKIQMLSENDETDSSDFEKSSGETLPTGRIVGILKKCRRDYVASFSEEDVNTRKRRAGENVLVIPYDYRIPRIRIATRQIESLVTQRIVVRIDSWNSNSQYPNGHFVKALGPIGDLATETSVLLIENGVSTSPFPSGVFSEMPSVDPDDHWTVDEEEIKKRRDLRSTHLIFSIDPEGCEDVDDAMSIKLLPNGRWELGVHIADVTQFVHAGSMTDSEARSRATTVYLADRRFDMLPRVLNSNVCSLLSNVDRYAVSVFWELNSHYDVCKVDFERTIIKSRYKLTYEVAQEIINRNSLEEIAESIPELKDLEENLLLERYLEIKNALLRLTEIGRSLKFRRMQMGALQLESIEVKFEFNEVKEGQVDDIKQKEPLEVHETVAECMIFANQWVAKKIYEAFPHQALLRRHPLPKPEYFKDLVLCGQAYGFEIDVNSNKSLAESLDRCVDPINPHVNNLMRQLATQAMSSAEYFSSGTSSPSTISHYGLGVQFYTHFTSPIRRYADILVHRLLLAFIDKSEEVSHLLGSSELDEVCEHINGKHKASQTAQKSSQQLFQALYFEDKNEGDERTLVDAVIFSIRSNGVLIYIHRYGIKGPVYLRNKENQVAFACSGTVEWTPGSVFNRGNLLEVTGELGTQVYKLFEHITVRIRLVHSHAHARAFRLDLVDKCPLVSDLEWGQQQQSVMPSTIVNLECEDVSVRHLSSTSLFEDSVPYEETAGKISLYDVLISLKESLLQLPEEKPGDDGQHELTL